MSFDGGGRGPRLLAARGGTSCSRGCTPSSPFGDEHCRPSCFRSAVFYAAQRQGRHPGVIHIEAPQPPRRQRCLCAHIERPCRPEQVEVAGAFHTHRSSHVRYTSIIRMAATPRPTCRVRAGGACAMHTACDCDVLGCIIMYDYLECECAFNGLAGADLLDLGLLLVADVIAGDCQRCQGPIGLHERVDKRLVTK